jgi:hypothetical protein
MGLESLARQNQIPQNKNMGFPTLSLTWRLASRNTLQDLLYPIDHVDLFSSTSCDLWCARK